MNGQNYKKAPSWFRNARKLAETHWNKTYNVYRDAVYLSDPKANAKIDAFISKEILPVALLAISKTRFRFLNGAAPCIEQNWYAHASRLVKFVVEDPNRPFVAGIYPPWHARLEIQCNVGGAGMFRDYLTVSLPKTLARQDIFDLLSETSDFGLPSQLSVTENATSEKSLYFVFENGNAFNRFYTPQERISHKIKAYCDFIEVAEEIEAESTHTLLIRKLIREINAIFQI